MSIDGMETYRCRYCGRFYRGYPPEGSACPNHIDEHNRDLRASIERHNARLKVAAPHVSKGADQP